MVGLTGIYQAQANPQTGRVLIFYNERILKLNEIIGVLQKIPRVSPHNGTQSQRPQEPEDLPIRRQMLNVALGGGVLAYLVLKHWLVGRTPLAKHPHIFNLAASTTIISGYPVFRSGLQGLTRGRINYDLLLSGLALGTTLARESVPGLMVMFLTNFATLAQSLVLKRYLETLPSFPTKEVQGLSKRKLSDTQGWRKTGEEYARKSVLPVLGLASLTGLTGGAAGWQRTLAMLLAANPSPVGLAAPTAAAASMAVAGKKGILYRDAGTLEKITKVDTVFLDGIDSFNDPGYELGDILPVSGVSKAKLLSLLAQANGCPEAFKSAIRQAATKRGYSLGDLRTSKADDIIVGDEKILSSAGVAIQGEIFKVRRLQHLQQLPIYVAEHGKIVGLVGLKQWQPPDFRLIINGLRVLGIKNIGLMLPEENSAMRQVCQELGIMPLETGLKVAEKSRMLRELKEQGRKIALVVGRQGETAVLKEAEVTIGILTGQAKDISPVDVLVPQTVLLPEVFSIAMWGEQRARQNVALVQVANTLGLALASTGRLGPFAAKVYGDLSALAVGGNSFRLFASSSKAGRKNTTLTGYQKEIAAAMEDTVCPTHLLGLSQCNGWHSMPVLEALHKLGSNLANGLNSTEVQRRIGHFGFNEMAEEKPKSLLARIWDQLKDFLVKTLMASAVVCAILGEFGDALAIVAILAVNALLGAMQEQRAEGALQALGKMTAPTAKVRRNGQVERIAAANLVPGDIVLLEQGDGIPADLRILEAHGLEIEEAALTGESYPVAKSASSLSDCTPLLDCENLAFMGTNVTRGRAIGLVTATGMSTEIGKIAAMLNTQKTEPTPLQNRMADVGGVILKYCLAVSGMVVLAGILRGGSLFKMFLIGVSLAVAAIPEGLPAVVTIALASGVRRMAKENAVVRHLPAVETLGSATLICTDKTGTLTQNRQQVQKAFTASGWWQAEGLQDSLQPEAPNACSEELDLLLTTGILCNDANLRWSSEKSAKGKPCWQVDGDPTEGALLLAGLRKELNYKDLREKWQRINELPFDATRLRMTVVCKQANQGQMAFVKGAPEVILSLCSNLQQGAKVISLDDEKRKVFLQANEKMTGEAMRVLALAYKPLENPEQEGPEESLILLGLVGMVDPPRSEVKEAIATCHKAGIKVVMITGDHPHTALAIAQSVGISNKAAVLTGRQLDQLSDLELAAAVKEVRVFARILPAQKLRLVQVFRGQGEILAMVGDGINDAPAVKEADIGVAMGQTGTDVTKQAADIILTDDNFATLVSAVQQGRGIYNNIRRSVRYLLATNVGLVLLVFAAVVFGKAMPLLPIQLLFLNVLGDGLPALALGVEPTSKKVMHQPPRPVEQNFFADGLSTQIISRGLATGLVGLETYRRVLQQGDLGRARTVALASFITSKLLFALECSETEKQGQSTSNRYLLGSVVLSSLLLAGAIYLPWGRRIFKTSSLGLGDISIVLGASSLTYLVEKFLTVILQRRDILKPESSPT